MRYTCNECGLEIIVIPATQQDEPKIVRSCAHETASIDITDMWEGADSLVSLYKSTMDAEKGICIENSDGSYSCDQIYMDKLLANINEPISPDDGGLKKGLSHLLKQYSKELLGKLKVDIV